MGNPKLAPPTKFQNLASPPFQWIPIFRKLCTRYIDHRNRQFWFSFPWNIIPSFLYSQGSSVWLFLLLALLQKENLDLDGEKSLQISIVAERILTQGWRQIMIMESKQALHYIYFSIFLLSCQNMLLIWSKTGLNLGTPKLVYPKSLYRCRK